MPIADALPPATTSPPVPYYSQPLQPQDAGKPSLQPAQPEDPAGGGTIPPVQPPDPPEPSPSDDPDPNYPGVTRLGVEDGQKYVIINGVKYFYMGNWFSNDYYRSVFLWDASAGKWHKFTYTVKNGSLQNTREWYSPSTGIFGGWSPDVTSPGGQLAALSSFLDYGNDDFFAEYIQSFAQRRGRLRNAVHE